MMSEPGHRRFRDALAIYEGAALPELGAVRTMDAIRLIESVEGFLPGGGVLYATEDDLAAAVQVALAQEDDSGSAELLRAEIVRFRELAAEHGLGALRSGDRRETNEPAATPADLPSGNEVARLVSRVVANLIQDGLHAALLLNPVGISVSEMGERQGALEQSAELVNKRWRNLANRIQKPLDIFRIAFPVAVLLFAVNSFVSCGGPIGSRTYAAMRTGAGVNQIRKIVAEMEGIGDPATINTLRELERRSGKPTNLAAEVFRLRRVRWGTVYLEHIETGKMVVISGRYIGSFDARGKWRLDD
jgi:hypothetical protein